MRLSGIEKFSGGLRGNLLRLEFMSNVIRCFGMSILTAWNSEYDRNADTLIDKF